MNQKGMISHMQHYSTHDGPGIRTTVFFKGCQLNCWWCHNPENINRTPETLEYAHLGTSEEVGRSVSVQEVIDEVKKDLIFYKPSGGGVTFSGGEPTLQFNFLLALAKAFKQEGIHSAIETNLDLEQAKLQQLLPHIDFVIADIKLIDKEKHRTYTGASNRKILQNITYLVECGRLDILRIPLIHGVNDSEEDLADFVTCLAEVLPNKSFALEVLPYHSLGESKYEALHRPYKVEQGKVSAKVVNNFVSRLKKAGFTVEINQW